jgi:hypothetical protein
MKLSILLAAAIVLAGPAIATESNAATTDPSNGNALVPPVKYQSPFHGYRPLGEDKAIPWKAANDEVQRIGGWREYAREAREPATPAPPGAAAPLNPLTAPAAQAPTVPDAKRPPAHDHSQHK